MRIPTAHDRSSDKRADRMAIAVAIAFVACVASLIVVFMFFPAQTYNACAIVAGLAVIVAIWLTADAHKNSPLDIEDTF